MQTSLFLINNLKIKPYIMELKDKPLDPQESLQLIQHFIAGARFNFRKSGFDFIFWGILVALAAFSQYGLLVFLKAAEYSWLPWPILMIGGALYSFIYHARKSKKEGVVTSYDHFFRWLFTCGCGAYFLFSFLCAKQGVSPIPVMLGLTSLLVAVTGMVVRFKPLLWGGFIFLAGSVGSVFLQDERQLLLMAAAILLGYLIPGILLTREPKS